MLPPVAPQPPPVGSNHGIRFHMTVRVLLFGAEAAALGAAHADVDIEHTPTCNAVKAALLKRFPALAPHLPAARLAVNSEFSPPDRIIAQGDEVALIGLVSGG